MRRLRELQSWLTDLSGGNGSVRPFILTEVEGSADEAELLSCGMVEVGLPLWKSLQTVEKRAVILYD
jgi:hypothetical protein